jgi:ferrous iron transport protein B
LSTQIVQYDPVIEHSIDAIGRLLHGIYPLSVRSVALLLLAGDEEMRATVEARDPASLPQIGDLVQQTRAGQAEPLSYVLATQRQQAVEQLLRDVVHVRGGRGRGFAERLSQAMMTPLWGIPILLATLAALYAVVGIFGAQTLVGWLENGIFARFVNPWVDGLVVRWIPWPAFRGLFGGEYGILTLAVRYAIAIILPIVGTFFFAFAVIEDSGYLPRLALLIDRVFKTIGLNGRAVIPMVLGFGCDTMATIVTRTLETRRERAIATILLALAIPCSAQLGVIFAILAGRPMALLVWALVVLGVFLLVGFLAARLVPGERAAFYMELPPLRLPRLSNILVKTYTRMEWYLREVLPIFVLASVLIWIGQMTGIFAAALALLAPAVKWIGLPSQATAAILFGFFRRDYGAAGLYDLRGVLDGVQLTVAAVTLTLFVPCIAQTAVMFKERGWKIALGVIAFIIPFAFSIAWGLSKVLTLLKVPL